MLCPVMDGIRGEGRGWITFARLPGPALGPMRQGMTPVFDIGDHDRLPWRFFGAQRTATALV